MTTAKVELSQSAPKVVRRPYMGTMNLDDISNPGVPQWLIANILPEAGRTILHGQVADSLKTATALGLAMSVAFGLPFKDQAAKRRNVLVVPGNPADLGYRLVPEWLDRHGVPAQERKGRRLTIATDGINLDWREGHKAVFETAEECQAGLVVVDVSGTPLDGPVGRRHRNWVSSLYHVCNSETALLFVARGREKEFWKSFDTRLRLEPGKGRAALIVERHEHAPSGAEFPIEG